MSERGVEREVVSWCVERIFALLKFIGESFELKRVTRGVHLCTDVSDTTEVLPNSAAVGPALTSTASSFHESTRDRS